MIHPTRLSPGDRRRVTLIFFNLRARREGQHSHAKHKRAWSMTNLPVEDATLASTKLSKIVLAAGPSRPANAMGSCRRPRPQSAGVASPRLSRLAGIGPQEALPPAAAWLLWGNENINSTSLPCQRPFGRNPKKIWAALLSAALVFRGLSRPANPAPQRKPWETSSQAASAGPLAGRRRVLSGLGRIRDSTASAG